MITPLIKLIDRNSLITFPSSLEDFSLSGQSANNRKVYFSDYALLNIPNIMSDYPIGSNAVDVERLQHYFVNGKNIGTGGLGDRIDLSESLQNYMLNCEAILTEGDNYKRDELLNTSERVFFKWLKEVGAIKYRKSSDYMSRDIRFQEADEVGGYNSVVKYISKIGMQGKVYGKKNSFNEVYVNIPSSVGNTRKVLFKSVEDDNYYPAMSVRKKDDLEHINGFNPSTFSPKNGLSLDAVYDKDMEVSYSSETESGVAVPNWHDYYPSYNVYLTDGNFQDPSNDRITMKFGSKTKVFDRSRLDGVMLDFDVRSYVGENSGMKSLEDYNTAMSYGSFDFNAILLYYTVEDVQTGEKATNLYGVAFIGDITQTSAGVASIERKRKVKSDDIVGNVGNGYGFRFNFKLDSRQEDVNPKIEVDEFETNTFSMIQFSEAMLRMSEILGRYEKSQELNEKLIQENIGLRDYIARMDTLNIEDRLAEIKKMIQDAPNLNNDFIGDLYNKYNEIMSGSTSVDVNIVTKFIGSNGISFLHDEEDNIMRLSNDLRDYQSVDKKALSVLIGNSNIVPLDGNKKLVMLEADEVNSQINIVLDDSIPWKKGQSISLAFSKNILGQAPLKVYTDAGSLRSTTPFNFMILETDISQGDVINITCLDASLNFMVTKTNML